MNSSDSLHLPQPLSPQLEQVLAAALAGVVAFEPDGRVAYATPMALDLLQTQVGAASTLPLRNSQGEVLKSFLELTAQSLPAVLRVGALGSERLIRVGGLPQQRTFLLQDFGPAQDEVTERQILDVLAHDLRAGLVPIKTYAQMLETGILGPVSVKQAEAMRSIDQCVERQAEKITAVLDMVKAQEDRLEVQREAVNLGDLLRKIVEPTARETKRRNLRLVLELDASVGLIYGDGPRLQRCLGTLLTRAVRQAPSSGSFGAELRGTGSLARIRIWDSGNGSRPEDVQTLTHSCKHRQAGRPDLELAAIYDVVDKHGGRIQVSTLEGAGTTCLVYLPLAKASPAESSPPRRALLVGSYLEAIRRTLEGRQFEVIETSSGREGVLAARERYFPLLVISDEIADLSAGVVQRVIREQRPDEPQVSAIVSASAQARPDAAPEHTFVLRPNETVTVDAMIAEIFGTGPHR